MTKFKFFRGYVGTLDLIDGETYATASIFNPVTYWTSEEIEIERIRRMQLANEFDGRIQQMRNDEVISHEQYMRNRDILIEQERIRRLAMINHSRETDNQIRLYQATRVTTVNPKWWMKIKIVLQETWLSDPVGMVVMTLLVSVVTFIGILKLFGA
jgi:hypothetical protein